jgi:hypothetical protein
MSRPAGPSVSRPCSRRDALTRMAAGAFGLRPCAAPAQSAEQPLVEHLQIGDSRLELQFTDGFDAALQMEARAWVQRSAEAVAGYFGRFPVPAAELLLLPVPGRGVKGGTAFALPSLFIRVRLGRETTREQFLADWVMSHEMVHLAVPRVPRSQQWLHEGIATYVEGVARGRAGLVAPDQVWREWRRDMPQGQPQAGDTGLDHTPTWGRTYWGGAMFCLLADVELRRRSGGNDGLRQALQGVLAAGGNYATPWPVARILATADAAVSQDVMSELYQGMKDQPAPVDLGTLWRQLGVHDGGLDDAAPLAPLRRAILS